MFNRNPIEKFLMKLLMIQSASVERPNLNGPQGWRVPDIDRITIFKAMGQIV